MMKIKKIAVCCLTVGCLSLGTIGVAAFAAGNPYEDYKNAVVSTVSQQNLTVSASVEMKHNSVTIASGNAVYQKASDSQYAKVSADINGESFVSEEYSDGQSKITSNGTEYSSKLKKGEHDNEEENLTPNTIKLAKMTADLFVGDLSNQFTSDGNTISVSLTDTQIPEIANVAAAAFSEMTLQQNKGSDQSSLENQLMSGFPIVQNTKIDNVEMTANVTDGNITTQAFKFTVSGNTADGTPAQVEISVNADIDEIGTTIPQTIDTTNLVLSANLGEED